MITYAIENVGDVRKDIEPLLALHYEELCLNKEAMVLAPDWGRYYALEKLNKLLIFTARDAGKLIGYSVFFADVHIHYGASLVAVNDVIFVHQDYRNKFSLGSFIGSYIRRLLRMKPRFGVGKSLIEYSEQQLRLIGAAKIAYRIKFTFNWSVILLRRGYQREEFVVGKIL